MFTAVGRRQFNQSGLPPHIPVNFLVCINCMPKKDNTKSSSIATHNGHIGSTNFWDS